MARSCEICGKGPQVGNQVTTRGKAKYLGGVGTKKTGITRRQFKPNLQHVRATVKGSNTSTPPINSEKAAAPSHNHDGHRPSGAVPFKNALSPLPPNAPKTFCAPCAIKINPSARRKGTVAHVLCVEMICWSIPSTFLFRLAIAMRVVSGNLPSQILLCNIGSICILSLPAVA